MNLKARRLLITLTALAVLTVFSGCRETIHQISRPLLGTIINLTYICEDAKAPEAAEAVFNEIARIEKLMSPYRKKSDIDLLNRFASRRPVVVSPETFSLIEQSLSIGRESRGAFDITFVPVARLYKKKGGGSFSPPSAEALAEALKLTSSGNIILNREKKTVAFKKPGVQISLGAIAKGYAVRRGVQVFKDLGITSAIVEEGGDLQVIGTRFGRPWRAGIRHPRKDELLAAIDMNSGTSIATSGDYERFTSHGGKKYHHIIDPRTGKPTETFASVSVIAADPIAADAWATAFFVMGVDETAEILKTKKDLQVVLVSLDERVYASSSLKGRISFFKQINVQWL